MYQTIQRKLNKLVMQLCHPEINQDDRLVVKYEPIGRILEITGQTIDTVSAR
jgi:hypothetical protein